MAEERISRRRVWLYPLVLLGGGAAALFFALVLLDLSASQDSLWAAVSSAGPSDMQGALGNLPEVVVAILGIVITVVSIILQLSATRYTPRVTEMFFRDRTNLIVLGVFVITSIHCLWATFAVHSKFYPRILVASTVVLMTAAILVLIPYFTYVFKFLEPERIVARLQEQALVEVLNQGSAALGQRQGRVLVAIEQLADVAINALSQKDRIITSRSVDAIKDFITNYLRRKNELSDAWYTVGSQLRRNPDFVVMASHTLASIEESRNWVEWKALRQYQTIFNESLNKMRDIGQLVAINTRYIGERALHCDDRTVLGLVIKFFNTYLRATLNSHDVRTAYNVFHQYRQLAENTLKAGWKQEVIELAGYFKYYGQTANSMGLSFVTETAANDLCALCEVAHREHFAEEDQLLATFLDVDRAPETEEQDRALRGVRKAQIKLATYYLDCGAVNLARAIHHDMEHERPERLQSIRQEMLAVTDRDFWEVSDRGVNFDYLEPSRRERLQRFYSWFADLKQRSEAEVTTVETSHDLPS
ncbi:MAG: hypothetical protein CSA65_08185 [Proteobacteria bacterium]|nr:MAG: hypothetical protein CSB49_01145 [Pseudomonadota bacterium]PIE17716.1 MAG: hypothetical protein CSA65_08185 [Pseudomonadota bacterium]